MKRLLMLATATAAFTTFAPMASQAQVAVEVPGVACGSVRSRASRA